MDRSARPFTLSVGDASAGDASAGDSTQLVCGFLGCDSRPFNPLLLTLPRVLHLSAQAAAPIDLTGNWVSIVNEDWRWRMITPPKGDYASVPLTDEGRKMADTWMPPLCANAALPTYAWPTGMCTFAISLI